jgi:dUTP pyrophosphatase
MKNIKIINKSNNELPNYATVGSSGMDLRAFIEKPIEIKPLERAIVPTGIFIELPEGHEAQIRPRSGLAAKHGITVLNSPGTIDTDYLGEIKVILINLGAESFIINNDERIAQMVIAKYSKISLIEVSSFNKITVRSTNGFGSTGNN